MKTKQTPGPASSASPPPDKSSKTLLIVLVSIVGFLVMALLIILIVGIVWISKIKNKIEPQSLENQANTQNYYPPGDLTPESQGPETVKTGRTKSERYPIDPTFYQTASNYWNCKYQYSFNYPNSWTIDDQSHNALQVFIKGSGVTVKLESIARVSGETLVQLANRRNEPGKISSDSAGTQVWSETVTWGGSQVVETDYVNPGAIVMHWLQGSRAMELMIFGTGFDAQFTNIEKMLATLDINQTSLPNCNTAVQAPKSNSSSGFNCATWVHPNGDLEYWWDDASAEEKQCYVDKYGAPPFYEP